MIVPRGTKTFKHRCDQCGHEHGFTLKIDNNQKGWYQGYCGKVLIVNWPIQVTEEVTKVERFKKA